MEGKKEVNESKDGTGGTRRNEKGSQEGQTLKEGLRKRDRSGKWTQWERVHKDRGNC